MKKLTTVSGVAVAAVVLSLGLVGCGSDTTTETTSSTEETTSTTTTTTSKAAPPTSAAAFGPNYTILDYVRDNGITETPIKRGDPGSPTIDLPVPEGWQTADNLPEEPYGAIVYPGSTVPNNPPRILALVAKLTGDVDPAKIIEFAPGEIKNLPGYESMGDGAPATLGGFDAFQIGGIYDDAGQRTIVAQKTVVIPGQDGLYVLQLNAYGSEEEMTVLMEATDAIDNETTITL